MTLISVKDIFFEELYKVIRTQCKIRVNLGFTVPYKKEITVLHKKKIKKLKISVAAKNNLKRTDFF